MGIVDFRYLVPPTGVKPVTAFADTLTGVDRPFFIGNDWFLQIAIDSSVTGSDAATQINISVAGLVFGTGSGVNNNGCVLFAYPSLVDRAAVVAKSLTVGTFAEMKLVSRPNAGVDAGIGPSILMNPGESLCYFIQLESSNTTTGLYRKNSNGSQTTLVANCFTNAPGDIVRLEARYVGGFPELRVYQNGVLKSTFTDNSGLGPSNGGQFGFLFSGVFSGIIVVQNFNGGLLT